MRQGWRAKLRPYNSPIENRKFPMVYNIVLVSLRRADEGGFTWMTFRCNQVAG